MKLISRAAQPGRWRWLIGGLLFGLTGAASTDTLKVGGTGAATDILGLLIADYQQTASNSPIEIVSPPLGSSGGIRALIAGSVQLAVSGRPPNESESKGLISHVWARSPLAFASNGGQAPASISRRELAAIYSGTTGRWPDGSPIRLVLRPASDSDSALLRSLSPEIEAAVNGALSRPGMVFAAHDVENAEMLTKAPGSLGTIPTGQIRAGRLRLRPLALEGVAPSLANLAGGKYPIAKEFHVSIRRDAPPAVKRFSDYLMSPTAHAILRRYDYLPSVR